MSTAFADTSFYAAIVNRRDELHEYAKQAAAAVRAVVTTEFMLVETANFCSEGGRRTTFVKLVENLRRAPNVEIIPASAMYFELGLQLFSARADKSWSLTDCI